MPVPVQLPTEKRDETYAGVTYHIEGKLVMETIFQRLSTGIFASAGNLFWNRFTGPGRIGLQSMYLHMPTGT